jgi:hypothetical protein
MTARQSMPSTTTPTYRSSTTWQPEGPKPSPTSPPQPWDGLAEPRSSAPKPPDLARIFAVDVAKRAGYVDHNGRLALLAGGRDANGGGPWRTEGVCVLYAPQVHGFATAGLLPFSFQNKYLICACQRQVPARLMS